MDFNVFYISYHEYTRMNHDVISHEQKDAFAATTGRLPETGPKHSTILPQGLLQQFQQSLQLCRMELG